MLVILHAQLRGYRLKIFDEVMKQFRLGLLGEDPKYIYQLIKTKLMEFQEGTVERQTRVKALYDTLMKSGLPAIPMENRLGENSP